MSAAKPSTATHKSLRPRKSPWLKRAAIAVVVLAAAGIGWHYYSKRNAEEAAGAYRTAKVERGDIRVAISATGALSAISTVDVGSQISGQVTEVLADFNDRVTKGQVIARIDPSTYEAQIAQGTAQVNNARASLATAQATLHNAELDFQRKSELAKNQLVARSDADLARAARDQARAQLAGAQAQINQQIASTQTSRLNLQRTVIRAPVDGVVLTRTVEPGQTVAASLQSPVLFQIAEDLSKMEIVLAIDEADIGQVKPGQSVNFSVDSFPDRKFRGAVQQVRLSATNTSNVITYPVVVSVDNADGVLLPGMTANAEIEVSHRDNVLRVGNAALRYKPSDDDAAAVGAPGGGGAARGGLGNDLPAVADKLKLDASQRALFDAALEQMKQRMASRTAAPASTAGGPAGGGPPTIIMGGGRGPGGGGGGNNRSGNRAGGAVSGAARQRMQERFKQQFGAFRATLNDDQRKLWDNEIAALVSARRAPLYKLVKGEPQAVVVRVGVSDGSWTEVSGNVKEGDDIIVGSGRGAK
ncbi:efflux RND transporter periplasmic adaptor subunit [Lysobacter gummosus]|uniref:Efflux RND transporter periplasmic adaptor subunit n=1 Tax=Lysobacter gummosus TaxID=262324 RepID=A0ABY3X741_9GAMM|nr:efflux RND transporter periplasmic adaptor subunit [Lysobacter gummosus]ALN92848.1 efflux transporter, RND family, MFP subunit [Lysobacter gummosus]UNP28393.1 efflux RND transporter periplasmic adaptor subunit [Lysobacter gummosus]